MKFLLAGSALMLAAAAAACSPAPETETAAPEAAAPAPVVAEPAPPAEEASLLTPMTGRWGVTDTACAPTNEARDGVIEISPATVAMGLDTCGVTSSAPEGAGVHVTVQCVSGEGGEDYERDFSFVSSTPETLTWITEGGSAEPYVRCE